MRWFITINPDHPTVYDYVSAYGMEGYGYICALIKHWNEIGPYDLDKNIFCRVCRTKPQKANRLLNQTKETLFRVLEVLRESSKTLQGLSQDSLKTDESTEASNPCGRIKDRNERKETNNPPTPKGERFDEFYQIYPVKKAKAKALSIWKRKNLDRIADQIIATVKRYADSSDWLKENGKYIPYPTTFLNQERWEDEIDTTLKSDVEYLQDKATQLLSCLAIRNVFDNITVPREELETREGIPGMIFYQGEPIVLNEWEETHV